MPNHSPSRNPRATRRFLVAVASCILASSPLFPLASVVATGDGPPMPPNPFQVVDVPANGAVVTLHVE